MSIQFFTEDIDYQLSNVDTIINWLSKVIEENRFDLVEINYIFCSDNYLLEINKKHLDHTYYTDIITFDNSDEECTIESDIFISVDRVKENAVDQGMNMETELHRVMIHGVLHLIGFGDKTLEEKKVMREKEDTCLSLLKI